MKKIAIIALASIINIGSFAQEVDSKAKTILDQLSATTKEFKTIHAKFEFTLINEQEDINESQNGEIILKGSNYFLAIAGQEVMSDGKAIYTVLKDAEEVQINNLPEEDEDIISPNTIFTMYETGFNYKYLKEVNGNHLINLYPKDTEEKEYHRLTLSVKKDKNQISKIEIFGKDGSKMIYTITDFITNTSFSDTKFTFNPQKEPSYEIVDLRD
jgi:outer membrane lipoprotein-sorting protein